MFVFHRFALSPGLRRQCALLFLPILLATPLAASASDERYALDIPPRPLISSITAIAASTGIQIVSSPNTPAIQAPALVGQYTLEQALNALLLNTSLRWEWVDSRTVRIFPALENSGSDMQLGPVRVQGKYEPKGDIYRAVGSVAVVTREEIDRLPPRNTADVLTAIPGVMTSNDRQNPGVRINIRGLEGMGRVNATIDGARQNYQQSGHTGGSSVYVDAQLLSGVDVKFGPSSGVGGAGVVGGTVNFRTLTADDILQDGKAYGARINAMAGTNQYHFSGSIAAALRTSGTTDVVAAVSGKDIGSYRTGKRGGDELQHNQLNAEELTFSDQDQRSALMKLRWKPNAQHLLNIAYVGFEANYIDNSTSTDTFSFRNHNSIQVDTLTLNHRWLHDNVLPLNSSLWYTRTTNDQFRDERGDIGYGAFDVHYETNTLGGSLDNTNLLDELFGFNGRINYGLEFFTDWTRPEAVAHNGGDPEWYSNSTPEGDRYVGSLFTNSTFVRGEYWELGLGMRYDWYRITGGGNVYTGPHESGNFYQPFSLDRRADRLMPSFKLAYQPWQQAQFFFSYSEGFRPPMITETLMTGSHPGGFTFPYLPNPNLQEELSSSIELGSNLNFYSLFSDDDRLMAKAALFNNRITHYVMGGMVMMPTEIISEGMKFSFVNVENPVRFYGLELQADYEARHFFSNTSLTWTKADLGQGRYNPLPFGTLVLNPDTRELGSGGGLMLATTPPQWRYSLGLGVRFDDRRYELGMRLQYVGNRNNMDDPVTDLTTGIGPVQRNSYQLMDAWALWSPYPVFQLRFAVQNLADEKYIEAMSSAGYLAPGRTALLSASLRF